MRHREVVIAPRVALSAAAKRCWLRIHAYVPEMPYSLVTVKPANASTLESIGEAVAEVVVDADEPHRVDSSILKTLDELSVIVPQSVTLDVAALASFPREL